MKLVLYYLFLLKMDSKEQIRDIVSKCIDDILSSVVLSYDQRLTINRLRSEWLNQIEEIIQETKTSESDGDSIDLLELPGKCCFCGDECNPLSQSCGSCSRGISGAVFGLPVPEHLKKNIGIVDNIKK